MNVCLICEASLSRHTLPILKPTYDQKPETFLLLFLPYLTLNIPGSEVTQNEGQKFLAQFSNQSGFFQIQFLTRSNKQSFVYLLKSVLWLIDITVLLASRYF